jgi:hypothetical protein
MVRSGARVPESMPIRLRAPTPGARNGATSINSLTKEQQKRQARSTVYLAIEMDESEQRPTRDAAEAPLLL